jgi:hypothetical protein
MKMMSKAILFSLGAAIAFSSCATVSGFGRKSAEMVKNTSERAINVVHPPKIRVVEVREKDLKKLPSGEERVLAFENSRKRSFWSRAFSGPVDFIEPTLPEMGGDLDGSLLPPKGP